MSINRKGFFQKKVKKQKYNKFFSYNNKIRTDREFIYKNFEKSNSYNTRFTRSAFKYTNFYKVIMKYCGFNGALFIGSEFKNANLKGSRFKSAKFKDVIFLNTKLDKTDFTRATFENVFFVNTSLKSARGINADTVGLTLLNSLPTLELSNELEDSILKALNNEKIKNSQTLMFNKKKRYNTLNIMKLLNIFTEEEIILGLDIATRKVYKNFYTLSYLVSFLKREFQTKTGSNEITTK